MEGWAYDPRNPSDSVSVEIRDGDRVVGQAIANLFREDLKEAGIGDGHHHFKFNLPADILNGQSHSISVTPTRSKTQLDNSPQMLEGGTVARALILDSGLFDATWYCKSYPDVAECAADPLDHYLSIGAAADYAPSATFDPIDYASRYPDWASSGLNPLLHYLVTGRYLGHTIHSVARRHERALVMQSGLFDESWYMRAYPDAVHPTLSPLDYYLEYGASTAPSPNFDPGDYVARYPDVLKTGTHPLVYYLSVGMMAGHRPYSLSRCRERALILASELFDERWYSETYLSKKERLDAVDDFLENCVTLGRAPSPHFDPIDYLERYKDVAEAGINPLLHYIQDGRGEERTIYGLGRRHERSRVLRSGLFDREWYLKAYPHVRHSPKEPVDHFLDQGGSAGYAPSPLFDCAEYLKRYPSVTRTDKNPLVDFLNEPEQRTADSRCQGPAVQPTRVIKPLKLVSRLSRFPTVVVAVCIDSLTGWEEVSQHLDNLPCRFMLLVLSTDIAHEELAAAVGAKRVRAEILIPQLLSFESLAGSLIELAQIIAQHDLLLYLNLQGSAESTLNRSALRAMTLKCLLGSPYLTMSIFQLFEEDRRCGIVYGDIVADATRWARDWRAHDSKMKDFLRSLHIPYSEHEVPLYSSCSMFWARVSAILPVLAAQVRKTLPYNRSESASVASWCFERAVGIVAQSRGYEIVQLSYRSGCRWRAAGSSTMGHGRNNGLFERSISRRG